MAKTRDIPQELREFNKLFMQLEYRHSTSEIFHDWLTMVICAFACQSMGDEYLQTVKRYTKEELEIFVKMFHEMIRVVSSKLENYSEENPAWYDFFGDYYQAISSYGKAQGLGQFFTPETLVTFMVDIISPESTGQTILDPACGSGRFLIASHSKNPRNFHFGVDIDIICCKMAVLNMMLHGCKGEIIHADALNPESYYRGWTINPKLAPTIFDLKKEDSIHHRLITNQFKKTNETPEITVIKEPLQLQLFQTK